MTQTLPADPTRIDSLAYQTCAARPADPTQIEHHQLLHHHQRLVTAVTTVTADPEIETVETPSAPLAPQSSSQQDPSSVVGS